MWRDKKRYTPQNQQRKHHFFHPVRCEQHQRPTWTSNTCCIRSVRRAKQVRPLRPLWHWRKKKNNWKKPMQGAFKWQKIWTFVLYWCRLSPRVYFACHFHLVHKLQYVQSNNTPKVHVALFKTSILSYLNIRGLPYSPMNLIVHGRRQIHETRPWGIVHVMYAKFWVEHVTGVHVYTCNRLYTPVTDYL